MRTSHHSTQQLCEVLRHSLRGACGHATAVCSPIHHIHEGADSPTTVCLLQPQPDALASPHRFQAMSGHAVALLMLQASGR